LVSFGRFSRSLREAAGTARNLKIHSLINVLILNFALSTASRDPQNAPGIGAACPTPASRAFSQAFRAAMPKDVFIEPDHDPVRPTLRDSH
jgi:hypothetical protein